MPKLVTTEGGSFAPCGSDSEALEAIEEAQALVEAYGERWPLSELHRLRAVLLAATSATMPKLRLHSTPRSARPNNRSRFH